MKYILQILCATAAMVMASGSAYPQAPATKPKPAPAPATVNAEIELLKIEMKRLRGDLELLKGHIGSVVQYIQQRDSLVTPPQDQSPQAGFNPAPARVSIAGAPTLGRADAPITIVEFSDFECPFCQRFFESTLPEIKRDYVDTGKVRYVFLDFPLEQVHRKARKAAEAAHCAAEQGKFWEMHDVLFLQKGKLDAEQYASFAKQIKLEGFSFDLCLNSGRHSAKITRSMANGLAVGIKVTPSFIITKTEQGDMVGSGSIIVGAQPYEQFRKVIEQALAAK